MARARRYTIEDIELASWDAEANPPQKDSDGLVSDVKTVLAQERAANLIPAAFLAFGLLDAVPIPTDAGFFYVQNWLDDHRDELTEREFWFYQYVNYYGWDVAWYLSLFAVTYFAGRTVGQKAVIGLSIVSLGAIVAEILEFSARHKAHENEAPELPSGP